MAAPRLVEAARIDIAEVVVDDDWDRALQASGRPFRFSHRACAGRALEAAYPSYRYTPHRVRYDDGTTVLYPLVRVARRLDALSMALGMPLGWEGTPVPLAGGVSAGHVVALFHALDGCGMLELHGGAGSSPPSVGIATPRTTHTLDLRDGFESVWSNAFNAKNRNVCRKAQRAGVAVAEDSTREGAGRYHSLYAASARAWGYAQPPYPRELFTALIDSGHAELWLAFLGEAPVAGALLLRGSNDLLYWSGAMNRDHRDVAPSNAVIRAAIESACLRGIDYFDFGASNGLTGVEAFKRSFGAQEYHYLGISLSSWRYRQLERARQLYQSGGRRTA